MGTIDYVVTRPKTVDELLDDTFRVGRHGGTTTVTAETDELALRRVKLPRSAKIRNFKFRVEYIQCGHPYFFITAQEVETNGRDGAILTITIDGDKVIISVEAGDTCV